ncbi:RICIN domain-containing protein [Streptomyces sp. V4I23]|uniref:RICIN domain-containing protein n=1 Tax=Streptomyces sp. V4I23 TaxID=3042282 RepID=UPI0027D8FE79|nr:RICIN domain-containing protein [Streptomyces sp. V4I23]
MAAVPASAGQDAVRRAVALPTAAGDLGPAPTGIEPNGNAAPTWLTDATRETAPAQAELDSAAQSTSERSAQGATRSATEPEAEARLATVGADGGAPPSGGDMPPFHRPKKPLLAAAGIAGVILVAVPLLVFATDDREERKDKTALAGQVEQPPMDDEEPPAATYAPEKPKVEPKPTKSTGTASHHSAPKHKPKHKPTPTQTEVERRKAIKLVPAPTKASPPLPKVYRVTSADTGKCLTASGSERGAPLVIWTCDGSASQNWVFHEDKTLRNGSMCVQLAHAATANGTSFVVAPCTGRPEQQFHLNLTEDLVALKANKCADVWEGKESNGTPIMLWPCTGTANQTWRRA